MQCSMCREEIHFTEVAFAQHAGCCTVRRLIGYRVVREHPTTGNREWCHLRTSGPSWEPSPSVASNHNESTATMAAAVGGRVVAVYLTVRRTKKGRAK